MSDQQIFNALVEFFEEDEWDFQWMEGASVLSMGFSGKNGKWQCFAQAREAQQQFVFYSVLPINVPPEKRQKVAELITRINYGMVIGNFEMDFDDGEVRYKTSVDVEGAELTPPMIRQMVYANIIITDRYLSAVMRTIYSDITPLEAIA
ncbi:MAG: YbjN domain-containing protein, partial [Aggregatilineales bacterium]